MLPVHGARVPHGTEGGRAVHSHRTPNPPEPVASSSHPPEPGPRAGAAWFSRPTTGSETFPRCLYPFSARSAGPQDLASESSRGHSVVSPQPKTPLLRKATSYSPGNLAPRNQTYCVVCQRSSGSAGTRAQPGQRLLNNFHSLIPHRGFPFIRIRMECPQQACLDLFGPGMVHTAVMVKPVLGP